VSSDLLEHSPDTKPNPNPDLGHDLPIRERQRLATRNRIFDVALAEIAERGLAGVRIEHVARKAGVTRPTIYAHFPAREDFLRELQRRSEASALEAVRARMTGKRRGHFLHRFADATLDLLDGAHPVLRRESFALMLREPRTEEWMGNALFGFLQAEIEKGQAQGEIPNQLPPRALTRTVMTALFGFFVLEGEAPATRKKQAHQLLDLLVGETKK